MSDAADGRGPDDYVVATDGEHSRVVSNRRSPVTHDDLIRYFRENYPPDEAEEHIPSLSQLPYPGQHWSPDIFLAIARFSTEHAERIREYLGWSPEQMAAALKSRNWNNYPEIKP